MNESFAKADAALDRASSHVEKARDADHHEVIQEQYELACEKYQQACDHLLDQIDDSQKFYDKVIQDYDFRFAALEGEMRKAGLLE